MNHLRMSRLSEGPKFKTLRGPVIEKFLPFFHSRYVQEDLLKPGDIHYKQFHKIFEMFKLTEGSDGSAKTTPTNQLDVDDESMSIAAKSSAAQKKQRDEEESEDEVREGKRLTRGSSFLLLMFVVLFTYCSMCSGTSLIRTLLGQT